MTVRVEEAGQRAEVQSSSARGLLAEAIDNVELGLLRDEPAFVRRMHRLQRAATLNEVTVVVFLVASAVFLTLALATQSLSAWVAGGLAFVTTFAVDSRYQRRLGRETKSRSASSSITRRGWP